MAAGAAVIGLSAAALSPTGAQQLQATIEHQLRQTTGGVQISDNAIAYDHGHVVEVFPDPGQDTAPRGLGSGVDTKLTTFSGQSSLGLRLHHQPLAAHKPHALLGRQPPPRSSPMPWARTRTAPSTAPSNLTTPSRQPFADLLLRQVERAKRRQAAGGRHTS
ncbi:hypothetical protein [Streptomyces sp. 135]|uniref:hypothetical protein n=1 Tax=Streptomyces sp. 135 TaxID=2838850 RepID=UPI001CBF83A7|nr:hypothetical protein [Streptomyces sp. 135]